MGRETNTAQRFYYHTDLLGSTRVVVQGTTVVEAYDYDPWGIRLDRRTLAGPTKEGFTAKERDAESGLDYFGARYYMAALGRWTSVDPLVDSFPAWNGYNYVKNDSFSRWDPWGQLDTSFRDSRSREIVQDLSKKSPTFRKALTKVANDPTVLVEIGEGSTLPCDGSGGCTEILKKKNDKGQTVIRVTFDKGGIKSEDALDKFIGKGLEPPQAGLADERTVLAHEIAGHAAGGVVQTETGPTFTCLQQCAIRTEQRIRKELGLPTRHSRGF